jgi:transcriptional regulator with XRE-family HTH domain
MNIPNTLKERRIFLGLTQKEAAQKAGISPRAYQYAESPNHDLKTETLKAICKALDFTIEFKPKNKQ